MNIASPLLSIIVPVYKVEKYLDSCLNSIFKQKIKEDIEVILVDDGSPDQCGDICDLWAKKESTITVLHKKNGGLSSARNAGYNISKGKYVWFVDSDDWLLPQSLDVIIQEIQANPKTDIFITGLKYCYKDNKKNFTDINGCLGEEMSGWNYINNTLLPTGASQRFIIRNSIICDNKLRFVEGILHEDAHFGRCVLYCAQRIKIIKTPLYAYRQSNESSIMSNITIRNACDLLIAYEKLTQFCEKQVSNADKLRFRSICLDVFENMFLICRKIIRTKDFDLFYTQNRNYIACEIKKYRTSCSFKKQMKYKLLLFSPRLYLFLF